MKQVNRNISSSMSDVLCSLTFQLNYDGPIFDILWYRSVMLLIKQQLKMLFKIDINKSV